MKGINGYVSDIDLLNILTSSTDSTSYMLLDVDTKRS